MYSKLKSKLKSVVDKVSYTDYLSNILYSIFDYDVDNINHKEYIEGILNSTGLVAFWYSENDKKFVFSECKRIGTINDEGEGKDLFCTTQNGHSKTFENFETSNDVVVIYNNSSHSPDWNVERYGDMLAETFISMRCAVINTRYNKIYRAKSEKEKTMFTTAINKSNDGIPQTIVSSDLFDNLDSNNPIIDLNDVSKTDRLQYLCNFYNFIFRDFFNKYGLTTYGTDKVAQQSVAEINNGATVSWAEILDRLNQRINGIKEINKKFNLNYSVKLSKCWETEYKKIFEEVQNDDNNENQ